MNNFHLIENCVRIVIYYLYIGEVDEAQVNIKVKIQLAVLYAT
jgi:hypothetical protein